MCLQAPVTLNAMRMAVRVLDPIAAITASTTSSSSRTTPGQTALCCYYCVVYSVSQNFLFQITDQNSKIMPVSTHKLIINRR